MELSEALRQISDIRQQMATSEQFRGYRSLTVGFSGFLGVLAATWQKFFLPKPMESIFAYVVLWMSVALISLLVAGGEMFWRACKAGPGLQRDLSILAAKQFLPCMLVGALLTLCLVQSAPEVGWMLPGLWSLIYALGVFASYRLLPREAAWVAVYYSCFGCLCLLYGNELRALSPLWMAGAFGIGQLLAAVILYLKMERKLGT